MHYTSVCHLLVVHLLLIFIISPSTVVHAFDWRQCVVDIPKYFIGTSETSWSWNVTNPCGFRNIRTEEMRSGNLVPGTKRVSYHIFGDSTALRMFTYFENKVLDVPTEVTKVVSRPSVISHTFIGGSVTFHRLLYISMFRTLTDLLRNDTLFETNDKVVIFFTLGNHDLNWKMHLKSPMPGLGGRPQNEAVAHNYWTKFSNATVWELKEVIEMRNAKSKGKLMMVYRQQYPLECRASRFTNPKRAFRDCRRTMLRTVRFYRKVLQPMLWQLNIPVMPTDFMFAHDSKACKMPDGVHLDSPCYDVEAQLWWNVLQLLHRNCVQHGFRDTSPLYNAVELGNVADKDYTSTVLPDRVVGTDSGAKCGQADNKTVAPTKVALPATDAATETPQVSPSPSLRSAIPLPPQQTNTNNSNNVQTVIKGARESFQKESTFLSDAKLVGLSFLLLSAFVMWALLQND
eukprot:PhM_4_TR5229/c0_g1_i2/m.99083